MKSSGRKAKLKEKLIISDAKLNPNNWNVVKHTNEHLIIKHKKSNNQREIKLS